jgi:CheY-like chemotaxis protein
MKLKEAAVLLVEDEPLLRETMGAWLKHKAGRALTAEHGAEAVKLLSAGDKIDLIISDVRMPVMDGIALVQHLNQAGPPRPGVIFLSGFSDLSLREAYHLGVEGVLEKPIDREELLALMQRSVAGADELWRQPTGARPRIKLKARFPSLATAQEEKQIAFGRRGFCIKSAGLREGPVDFAVDFEADQCALVGQGVVRWTATEEGQAGIEIAYVDDASRAWVLDLVQRTGPVSFIPRSTGMERASSLEAA